MSVETQGTCIVILMNLFGMFSVEFHIRGLTWANTQFQCIVKLHSMTE